MKKLISVALFAFLAASAGYAETFNACLSSTFTLPEWKSVSVVADSASTAVLTQLAPVPGSGGSVATWSISASGTQSVGPFSAPQRFSVVCVGTGVTYEFADFDPSDYVLLSNSSGVTITAASLGVSGVFERKVTNVTVADDGAGTKPAGAIPITTDFATCTCNDATGCAMTIAEPTVTSGYGRMLTIASVGTGNCEFAESTGVVEIGAAIVAEPTSTVTLAYVSAAWRLINYMDNVP